MSSPDVPDLPRPQASHIAIPLRFRQPPQGLPNDLPARPRENVLPMGILPWDDFEKLIYTLARLEAEVVHCAPYGRPGQPQHGVDIFARLRSGKYRCWQAKNYKRLRPTNVADAVDRFMDGIWLDRTERFILCVRTGLNDTRVQDEVERQAARLQRHGIEFVARDATEITQTLRDHPQIICQFFNREWVAALLGQDVADALGARLDPTKATSLKETLASLYDNRFRSVDPGLSFLQPTFKTRDIRERFVRPDVDAVSPFTEPGMDVGMNFTPRTQSAAAEDDSLHDEMMQIEDWSGGARGQTQPASQSARMPLEDWLLESQKLLLLGGAGFGKSTVLRCVALDLLTKAIAFPQLTARLGNCIPVLVPFALWTRLSASKGGEVSLKEAVVHAYGSQLDARDIEALIEYALRTHTLILLIDGLDEYPDEQAARTTLLTIDTFVRARGIPAIFTGRPAGVRKLGILGTEWRVARLQELTRAQQREVASRLLVDAFTNDDHSAARALEAAVGRFFSELDRTSRMQALAGTPLVLSGLLSVSVRKALLPPTRFQLFENLIELLMDEHPKRRATAAADTQRRLIAFASDAPLRRDALAKLAFEIQCAGEDAGMSRTNARKVIETFLADPEGPGWTREKARAGALELIDIDSETSGLLVERSSDEVAFCHAAFREHLAGLELSRWSLEEQSQFASRHADDPRWRAAILVLVQSTKRKQEVEAILQSIRTRLGKMGRTPERRALLTEAAFSAAANAGAIGLSIATQALDLVEESTIDSERLELLQLALDGPREGPVGLAITERLGRWWPGLSDERGDVFRELKCWPPHPDLRRVLWVGLRDTNLGANFEAAETLATVFKKDKELPDELLSLARRAPDAETGAAALHALGIGWPARKEVERLVATARKSSIHVFRAVGSLAAYRSGSRTKIVRDELLEILVDNRHGPYFPLISEATECLVESWAKDRHLHDECWDGLLNGTIDRISAVHARVILACCHAHDERLGKWLTAQFRGKRYPNDEFFYNVELMGPVLEANATFRAAVDKWMDAKRIRKGGYVETALAGALKTPRAKAVLLTAVECVPDARWLFLQELINGWSTKDKDVRDVLANLRNETIELSQYFANCMPFIIKKRDACRKRLLEIAELRDIKIPLLLVIGFRKLGCPTDDSEVVSALWPHLMAKHNDVDLQQLIIKTFHMEPRVKAFALEQLDTRSQLLPTIAATYAHDPDVRAKVLARALVLPPYLRRAIATRAAQRFDDPALREVLAHYRDERDLEAKCIATIGHCVAVTAESSEVDDLHRQLHDEFHTGQSDDTDRVAAITGLITIDQWKTVLAAVDDEDQLEGVPLEIHVALRRANAPTALGLIAEHWEEVASSGKYIESALCDGQGADAALFWRRFAPHVTRSAAMMKYFMAHCASEAFPIAPVLTTLARLRPKSDALLAACRRALLTPHTARPEGLSAAEHVLAQGAAARILAGSFPLRDEALDALVQSFEAARKADDAPAAAMIGLAAAWPEHPLVASHRQTVSGGFIPAHLNYGLLMCLASAVAEPKDFAAKFALFAERGDPTVWGTSRLMSSMPFSGECQAIPKQKTL